MTEEELISEASNAVSESEWIVGRCAAMWCKKFARGRTDVDFAQRIGLSGDQVYSRRRVWDTFADVKTKHQHLKWSHFYVALTWEDSAECLAWADENDASVAEMKAWRRMQHGEDLTTEPIEVPEYSGTSVTDESVSTRRDPMTSRNPDDESREAAKPRSGDMPATMATLRDDSSEPAYSPFRNGASAATAPRPEDDAGDGATRDAVLIRKTCTAVGKAIIRTDDARQFVAELLGECWRAAQGDTADAIKAFIQDKPLCR